MEWHHPQASQKKKFTLSADKVATTVDWDCEGVIFVDEMARVKEIICDYIKILKELTKRFK